MAFGTNSKIFRAHIANLWGADAIDFLTDTAKVALFGDAGTPDQNVALSLTGYNAATSQWVAANEKTSSTDWPAGGQTLTSKVIDQATGATVFIDAADAASGSNATLSDVRGVLVYDDTVSGKPGFCFNAFGGAQAVTAGTFTVVFAASGITRITL